MQTSVSGHVHAVARKSKKHLAAALMSTEAADVAFPPSPSLHKALKTIYYNHLLVARPARQKNAKTAQQLPCARAWSGPSTSVRMPPHSEPRARCGIFPPSSTSRDPRAVDKAPKPSRKGEVEDSKRHNKNTFFHLQEKGSQNLATGSRGNRIWCEERAHNSIDGSKTDIPRSPPESSTAREPKARTWSAKLPKSLTPSASTLGKNKQASADGDPPSKTYT